MRLPGWPGRGPRTPRDDAATPAPHGPPRTDRRTYVVGDIHGRHDLLEEMLARIAQDAAGRAHDLVFLGDYVDRGPDSAAVLRRLAALAAGRAEVTCLLGNHDRLLLQFLAAPAEVGARWLAVGGDATLASFGVALGAASGTGPDGPAAAERHRARAAALAAAMGEPLRDWLAARPLWWARGDLVAVHALTDPARAMEEQDPETLLWARPGRDLAPRQDGRWVVHGHTITAEPTLRAGHIGVDTGAFRSGRLTALVADPQAAPRFLQTGPPPPGAAAR